MPSLIFYTFQFQYLSTLIPHWAECDFLRPRLLGPGHVAAEARVRQRGVPHLARVRHRPPLRLAQPSLLAVLAAGEHRGEVGAALQLVKRVQDVTEHS